MDKLFCHLFLWISYGQFVHSNIMNDNFICISGFKLTDTPILDINITVGNGSVIKCFAHCSRMENCKSVSVKKDSTLCRLYDVSIAAIGSSPVQDVDWDTFTYKGWYPIIKYSTGNTVHNGKNPEQFYYTENYVASFPDDSCGVNPAQKCNRPYKHTLQHHLLSTHLVKQMQVRVYKDGSKTAWVTFSKNPGTNDNWFHTSRVLNCHPWNKARLKATSTVMDKGLPSENMYWLISEGFKNSNQPIGTRTPHAHWLVIKGRNTCDMAPNVAMPAILYSKKTTATYLATHDVGKIEKFDGGNPSDIRGTEANAQCNKMHTTLATWSQVAAANSQKGYSCCEHGWMRNPSSPTGYSAGLPMTHLVYGCGHPGVNFVSHDVSRHYGAYCRVDHALAHKGIEYEYRSINGGKQLYSEDFTSVNPLGQIPALLIDGQTLTQSLPIIEYLEETRPQNPVFPKDPAKRAKCRQIAEIVNAGIQPLQNSAVREYLVEISGNKALEKLWTDRYVVKGLQAIETLLESCMGRYCVGNEMTLSDMCLLPQIYNAEHLFGIDIAKFPRIQKVCENLREVEAFQKADPSNQPDFMLKWSN